MVEENRRSWKRAYRLMGYSVEEYILRLILPFTLAGVAALAISFLFADLLGPSRYIMYLLAVFFPVVGIFYPKIWADTKKREIEQNIHLFITHAGVLATAEIDRIEIFKQLSTQEEEYGPLANEIGKVVELVETWNRSLEEACSYVARRTPSDILSDFLDRLSRTAAAGEDMGEFLIDEQEMVISDYESMYKSALDRIGDFRDLFLSMILATVFLTVFSIIAPLISGISPLLLVGAAIGVFIVSEIGFILATKFTLPEDPTWCKMDISTERDTKLGRFQILSLILFSGTAIFSGLQLFYNIFPGLSLPFSVYIALPLTPLAVPGLLTWREENKIKRRDTSYPDFIRTLATSASARRATSVEVLDSLKEKDFGALTRDVRNLYKRLRIRTEANLAWNHFSADSGSYLIQRFNDMYFEGTAAGGDPKIIGDMTMKNFKRITRIREARYGFGEGLKGVLYGVTAAAVASFSIGFHFMEKMVSEISSMAQPTGVTGIFSTEIYNFSEIHFLLIILIFMNAFLVSSYIRSANGGHQVTSYAHVPFLVWLGLGVGLLVDMFVTSFLGI